MGGNSGSLYITVDSEGNFITFYLGLGDSPYNYKAWDTDV